MAATEAQRERELKFDLPPGWELRERGLRDLVPAGGSVERETIRLESTYYDTERHGLLRAGLTLRRRTGDADTGWHLKVPAGDARTELRQPLNGRSVPAELRELVRGASAGEPLAPVASLATERAIVRLLAADRTPLAELAVDDVTAGTLGAAEPQTWREVEIELAEGDEKLLARAAKWLQKSGARPAATGSKLVRALGDGATRPADPGGIGGLVAAYLREQHDAILRGDIELRRGNDMVHKTRVGTRRYRSVLRVFRDILDGERAAALDEDLKWYAGVLGELRDRQVLRAHLDEQLAALPAELVLGPVAARIHETLDSESAKARVALDRAMRSRRYLALLRELAAWEAELPLTANPPAKKIAKYLRKTDRKVATRLATAEELPDGQERDEAMHRARKAAKRARYTAELAEPLLGDRAAAAVDRLKTLQTHLGDRQDGVVAADFLLRLGRTATRAPRENGFTFGLLFERERGRREHAERAAEHAAR